MQIAKECLEAVAFISGNAEGRQFNGTGFFIAHEGQAYFVTAAHCAMKLVGKEFNLKIGNQTVTAGPVQWHFHQTAAVDVAVALGAQGGFRSIPWNVVRPLSSKFFLTPFKVETKSIGPGDQAYIVGLYRMHGGAAKHTPIVHTGNIALMADESEPIRIKDWQTQSQQIQHVTAAYLIEAQTLEGLSGSPVFARRSLTLHSEDAPNETFMAYGSIWLLGLWHGAFETVGPGGGEQFRVPAGMGVAIPAIRILEVLGYDRLRTEAEAARTSGAPRSMVPEEFQVGSFVTNSMQVLGPTGFSATTLVEHISMKANSETADVSVVTDGAISSALPPPGRRYTRTTSDPES